MPPSTSKPPRNGAPPHLPPPALKATVESPGLSTWLIKTGKPRTPTGSPAVGPALTSLAKAAAAAKGTKVSNSFAAFDDDEDDGDDEDDEDDANEETMDTTAPATIEDTLEDKDRAMQEMDGRTPKELAPMGTPSTPAKKARRNSPQQPKPFLPTQVPTEDAPNAKESAKIHPSTPEKSSTATHISSTTVTAPRTPSATKKPHSATLANAPKPPDPPKQPSTVITPAKHPIKTSSTSKADDDSSVNTQKASSKQKSKATQPDDAHKGVSARVNCQASLPRGTVEVSDSISKVKEGAGQLLDFLMAEGDSKLVLHGRGKTYKSRPPVTFEALFTNMDTEKAKKVLGIPSKVDADSVTVTISILFEFTSSDPKALDNLNARCFAKFGNSSVVITACHVKPTSSIIAQQSIAAQMAKASKLEAMSGGKVYRTEYSRFTLKLDLWGIPKHEKHKDSVDYDKFVYQYLGDTFDWINSKLGCDILFMRWRKAFLISPISSKDGTFKKQFKSMNFLEFKKIFHRAIVNPEKRDMWGDVLIAFNCEKSDFNEFIRDQVSPKKGLSLFPKHLQDAEDTKPLFWILWSHDLLETKPLQETLTRLLKVPIELRLKRINDDSKRGTKEEEMKKRAWHIQVSHNDEHMAHSTLKLLCRASNPKNPLFGGQKLIPITGECLTDTEQAFMAKSVCRQHSFNDLSVSIPCGSIKYLDMEVDTPDGGSISLRKAIGNMRRKEDANIPLFMEVGWRISRRDGPTTQVLFIVTPDVRAEAQLAVNSLLPFCRHQYGDNIARCFQGSIVSAMAHISWDPDLNRAVSPNDVELEQMEAADSLLGFDLPELEGTEEGKGRLVDTTPADSLRSKLITGNQEVDTLGSFDAAQKGIPLPRAARKPLPKASATVVSTTSSIRSQVTTGTTKDRVSQLELKLKGIAIKAGMWDSDDESISTTLTQTEKISYLTQKMDEIDQVQKSQEKWQRQQANGGTSKDAGITEQTAVPPRGEKPVIPPAAPPTAPLQEPLAPPVVPGADRSSAIFLEGSPSDSSASQDYSILKVPDASVDSLDELLKRAPPSDEGIPQEALIPSEIVPVAPENPGEGDRAYADESEDLTDASSKMVKDGTGESSSGSDSSSSSQSSDAESDGLESISVPDGDVASPGATGAGKD
jgi:hypothetical protein